MILKEAIRHSLSRTLVGTGLTAFSRNRFTKKGALILYGHRIQDDDEGYLQGLKPDWFEEQIEYIGRHYNVISLSELNRCFENGLKVPKNSVVLTLDDGFRDNFENAFPILERHHFPATIFLVTGCIENGLLPWPQRLGFAFQNTGVESLCHTVMTVKTLPLGNAMQKYRAYLAVKKHIRELSPADREKSLLELEAMLKIEPPRDRMLTWEQAKIMINSGIEFGAHSYSHPLMAYLTTKDARLELQKSRDDLKRYLGVERPPYCFPGGSYTSEMVEMVKSLNFGSLFQSRQNLRVNNIETTHQFAYSRIGLPNAPAYVLEAELDGPLHTIRKLYRD